MGMYKLQVLSNELDVHQPTGDVLQIPPLIVTFFLCNGGTHFHDIPCNQGCVAWLTQNSTHDALDACLEFA